MQSSIANANAIKGCVRKVTKDHTRRHSRFTLRIGTTRHNDRNLRLGFWLSACHDAGPSSTTLSAWSVKLSKRLTQVKLILTVFFSCSSLTIYSFVVSEFHFYVDRNVQQLSTTFLPLSVSLLVCLSRSEFTTKLGHIYTHCNNGISFGKAYFSTIFLKLKCDICKAAKAHI